MKRLFETATSGVAVSLVLPSSASGATLFADQFGGGGGDLNGEVPGVTSGANWVASTIFNADGTTEQGAGSATLAFSPADGLIYNLDVRITGISPTTGTTNNWIAAGFVNGQSTLSGTSHRFITGEVVGTAWMMHRGDISLGTNQTFLGTGQLGSGNFGLGIGGGNNTGEPWALDPASPDIDLRIVLDTTAGPGAWTSTWFAKSVSDSTFTEVRPTTPLLPGATISAVGVARANGDFTATLESFTLTSVPEPSAALLALLGGLAGLRRRR
jgi:MYXO-CTERM domain-containing protein